MAQVRGVTRDKESKKNLILVGLGTVKNVREWSSVIWLGADKVLVTRVGTCFIPMPQA